MATGLGKGTLFANLVRHRRLNKRAMMLVHTIDLVEQGAKRIRDWNPGLSVGIEMADQFSSNESVVVGSVQTLGRADSKRIKAFDPNDFDWLIVDEAHHATADTYKNVFRHFNLLDEHNPITTLVGYTATPNRSDGVPMGSVFDEIVYQYSIQDGIKNGWLVDIKGIRVKTDTDLSTVSVQNGDYKQDELEQAVNTPYRNRLIAEAWIENCYPRKTVIFCVDVQHARDMARAFQQKGIPADAVWGSDPERKSKMQMFKDGLIQVMMNVKVLTEGFDLWSISCVVPAAPSRSQGKLVQQVGRGTRLQEGIDNLVRARKEGRLKLGDKVDLLVMDVCDVTGRHSLVTLPTLFGLGPKLDLNGSSVMYAVQELEEVQAKHPDMDLSKLEDFRKLKSYVEEANLWAVNFCEEITEASELQWHKTLANTYRLLLPGKEKIVITGDLLGKYNVRGTVMQTRVDQMGFDNLPDALAYAEAKISKLGKQLLTLLRRESKWHKEPVSVGQLKLLRQFKVPEHVIAQMNKGSAAKFITKRLGEHK